MSDENNQQQSSLDSLLARSWASRAALSRQAHLEPKAEETLRQNSEEAQATRTLLHSRPSADEQIQRQIVVGGNQPEEKQLGTSESGNHTISGRDRGLDFTNNSNTNPVPLSSDLTTTTTTPSRSNLISPSSAIAPLGNNSQNQTAGNNNLNLSNTSLASISTSQRKDISQNQNQNQNHEQQRQINQSQHYHSQHYENDTEEYQTSSSTLYKYHQPATMADVDNSQTPIIPTPRGYREFLKEAAEEGGIAALSSPNSNSRNNTTPSRRSHSSNLYHSNNYNNANSYGKNYYPGEQVSMSSSSATTPNRRTITIDSINQIKVGQSPIQTMRHNGSSNNDQNPNTSTSLSSSATMKNRSLQAIQENELHFLHQAYGDPTLSIITHWTLLHQNLALELLARHWMMLLDASRLTSKHDRSLAAAALMQLKVSNNELSQVREELAEEKAKNAALRNQHVLKSESDAHASNPRARSPAGGRGENNNNNNNSSQPRNQSPSRNSSVLALNPTIVQLDEHQHQQQQNQGAVSSLDISNTSTSVNQRKSVSFSPTVLPHPSQHVPLVWSSSVIQQQQHNNSVRGPGQHLPASSSTLTPRRTSSPQVSIARRNSPGRIQRRDMQF